jgi:hypothetical protein
LWILICDSNLLFIAVFLNMIAAAPLLVQETTLTVGTAGNITAVVFRVIPIGTNNGATLVRFETGNSVGESISTAQIDNIPCVVAPGIFGQNFTRDKTNKAFADFGNFRTVLAASLAQSITTDPNIRRVNSVNIDTNNLNLRLAQKNNSVTAELGSIIANISLVADVDGFGSIFCPSANVSFRILDIKASGEYNYITGDISNANVAYVITSISSSCNGALGFIGNLYNLITGTAESKVRSTVQSQVNSQLAFINMKSLFSLSDFANGLRYYGNKTITSSLVNRAINVFRELVNDAAINTPGIVLNVGVEFAAAAGTPNRISFVASYAPVDVVRVSRAGVVILNVPPNTESSDIYYDDLTLNDNWKYAGST